MIVCPTCEECAEYKVYQADSHEFPAGPAIRVCHTSDGAYVHVLDDD
jgi:hypothetical protein